MTEKFTKRILLNINSENNTSSYILDKLELKRLKKTEFISITTAVSFGIITVLLLYLPLEIYPNLFPTKTYFIPLLNINYDISLEFLFYSLIVIGFELFILSLINIFTVKEIGKLFHFPNSNSLDYDTQFDILISLCLNKDLKEFKNLSINPYEYKSKLEIIITNNKNQIFRGVSNFLAKGLAKKLLGRYAFRYLINLSSLPVYAIWNGITAKKLIKETKIRMMAPAVIEDFCENLYSTQKNNSKFIEILPQIFHDIICLKGEYHHNHYLLYIELKKNFGEVPFHEFDKMYIDKVDKLDHLTKEGFSKLLYFGIIIDNLFSKKEKRRIEELRNKSIFKYDINLCEKWSKDYINGKGLNDLIKS